MQEQLFERAYLLFQQNRHPEAYRFLIEILASNPNHLPTISLLIEIKIENGELVNALKLTNDAIALNPENDTLFYTKSRILMLQNKLIDAEDCIKIAIEIDAYETDNFALLAQILLLKKQFQEALNAANLALNIDASNVFALNARSTALLKLGRKNDSYDTIKEALNEDPNNAYTHANFGWNLLEKGSTDEALIHFSESLKNNPNSDYAQSGMIQALKSKYLIYRWFLKYSFWMSNFSSKNQWYFIAGLYFGTRILNALADNYPMVAPFILPIVILIGIFSFSTWIIAPLSNVLFSQNKYGKHLLSKVELNTSKLLAMSLLISVFGVILIFYKTNLSVIITVFGLTMMIPLSGFYKKPFFLFKTYSIVLFILGFASIISVFYNYEIFNPFSMVYLFLFVAYQFISNYFSIKQN